MTFGSIVAIYVLFWFFCLFLVLPFRLQTGDAAEEAVPGQDRGAPPRFSVWRTVFWTTIVSAIAFALYYANYVNGWIGAEFFQLIVPQRH
ncbi:DUF1467 family protein [Sphingomonas sp. 1P06PA]|uniref:DUF1467 family protein n=1 Tax=Sphingomonas sp. 1P06PA TaxID=554121 RepID=UPI0039A513A0